MGNIVVPNIPDVNCQSTKEDKRLYDILVAIKTTLEKLTGADPKSNSALIDLLNSNQ
jgi:hypothetical protein